ncbi:MAG: hypothetical protein WDZ90_02030 [Candidatus Paceibacterota bacterium]
MDELKRHIKNDSLFQGYLIEGDLLSALAGLYEVLPLRANPNAYILETDKLSADEGRKIKELASNKGAVEGKKYFVIAMHSGTPEAQNALLKALEEPTRDTHFFILVPNRELLLGTVRSRLSLIEWKGEGEQNIDVRNFLKATKADRVKLLEPLVEERSASDALLFLNYLEKEIYEKKGTEKGKRDLLHITEAKKLLSAPGASVRQILEYVVATLA